MYICMYEEKDKEKKMCQKVAKPAHFGKQEKIFGSSLERGRGAPPFLHIILSTA